LHEIIFGLRCPENEKKKYRRLVENKFDYPIKFYQIRKMRDSSQFEKRINGLMIPSSDVFKY